jgi:sensor histidine kinase YesM
MKLNRKKIYPAVLGLAFIGSTLRAIIFFELGWAFYTFTLAMALAVTPLLVESAVRAHNWFDRRFGVEINVAQSNARLVQRIIAQNLSGVAALWTLSAIVFFSFHQFIPDEIRVYVFSRPFLLLSWLSITLVAIVINSALLGKDFFDRWKAELLRNERLKQERAEAQFESLKNQLNPHFLFNALTSLHSLIKENPALASEFVLRLAKIYRYILQSRERELVALEEELQFVRQYCRLLQTRFGEALHVRFAIPDGDKERLIAPVTLQTLIENAVKHNVVHKRRPLYIEVFTESIGADTSAEGEERRTLVVENTLQARTLVETSNKQGLANIQALYAHLRSGAPVRIETRRRSDKIAGEVFRVSVPLL